jgi:hypothetical protein
MVGTVSMPEPQHRRAVPCQACPWRVNSKRTIWPVERFHDLRFELLQPQATDNMAYQSKIGQVHGDGSGACQGLLEFRNASKLQLCLTGIRSESAAFNETPLFPSFEAMADANGAGLYEWTSQLATGDLVVYLKHGIPKAILEVARVLHGVIEACTDHNVYRFNNLGYEMQTVIDSRILPATPAMLRRLSDQLPKQPL